MKWCVECELFYLELMQDDAKKKNYKPMTEYDTKLTHTHITTTKDSTHRSSFLSQIN
jgi:hypothetical protein